MLSSLLWISALLCPIKMKFDMLPRYVLGKFLLKFHKTRIDNDVIVTSFKISPNTCPNLKFDWTYKRHTWYYMTTWRLSDEWSEIDLGRRWRSQANFNSHKNELIVISRKLSHSQTSYQVPRYNTKSAI